MKNFTNETRKTESYNDFFESEGLRMFMALMENNDEPSKDVTEEALYQVIRLLANLAPESEEKYDFYHSIEKEKTMYLLERNKREISVLYNLFSKLEKDKEWKVTEADYREYYNNVLILKTKNFSDDMQFKLKPEQICWFFIAGQNDYLDLTGIIENGYFKLGMVVARDVQSNCILFKQTNFLVEQLELENTLKARSHFQNAPSTCI